MTHKRLFAFGSAILLAAAFGLSSRQAEAKKPVTVTEREERLKQEINQGQKSGDLTLKESEDLRNQEAKIEAKQLKMKAKNGGKLSYDNENTLEKDLNKLSLKIQKLKLAKRVEK